MDSILREIASLASDGVREHILIAQDTSRYGHDTKSGSLASLVREAAAIPGVEWLRVLYCYPDETNAALIDEMAAHRMYASTWTCHCSMHRPAFCAA